MARTLWHEVIEIRNAEHQRHGAESRENWVPADPAWMDRFEDHVVDVHASMCIGGKDPRAALLDLMAHLAANVTAMDDRQGIT